MNKTTLYYKGLLLANRCTEGLVKPGILRAGNNDVHWDLILPSPTTIVELFAANPFYYLENWWSTFSVSLSASLLSLSAALVTSIAGLRYTIIEKLLAPTVAISQSFPLQAIAPLIIIGLGTGFHSKLAIATLISLFPIYASTAIALKSTPRAYLIHLRVAEATFWTGVRLVRLPIAIPAIMAATKVGFTLAVLGAVVAEFIQPDKGLGRVILMAQSQFDANVIYLCVLLLAVQGLLVFATVTWIENRLPQNRAIQRYANDDLANVPSSYLRLVRRRGAGRS